MDIKQVPMNQKEYVVQLSWEEDGETKIAYRVAGTRVSLDSVVYSWLSGYSPEGIVESFPSLKLEQVHGALAYYLANREEIDEYLRQGEIEFEQMRQKLRVLNEPLYQKLEAYRNLMKAQASASD
ncbi:MAG: hypothetical protein JMDDDDMK_00503 [Acidobacteria bacterium]|nr:hypothetical protein [Acidobacteriota bacterium]